MMHMSGNLNNLDRIKILVRTAKKVGRGTIKKIFLGKYSGLLFVGKHVSIMNAQHISVGKNVKFEDFSEIQGLSTNGLIFGNSVTIGRNVKIRPSSYYGVGHIGYGCVIGDNSSIGPDGFIGCAGPVRIGKQVMIGPNVMIIAENHIFSNRQDSIKNQGVVQRGVVIEDNVWIGANVTILDGVIIHSGVVVGAGTVVTKSIEANTVNYDKRHKVSRNR